MQQRITTAFSIVSVYHFVIIEDISGEIIHEFLLLAGVESLVVERLPSKSLNKNILICIANYGATNKKIFIKREAYKISINLYEVTRTCKELGRILLSTFFASSFRKTLESVYHRRLLLAFVRSVRNDCLIPFYFRRSPRVLRDRSKVQRYYSTSFLPAK